MTHNADAITKLLEAAYEHQLIVREQIAQIRVELASDHPQIIEGGVVVLEGEHARDLLTSLLARLIAADEVYQLAKSTLMN